MRRRAVAVALAGWLCGAAGAAPYDGRQHDVLELGGRTETVAEIVQQE